MRDDPGGARRSYVTGPGWFLFNAQVHTPSANPGNVEPGQLLAMKVDSFRNVY